MRRYRLEIRGKDFVIDVEELGADRFAVMVGNQSYEVTLAGDEDLPGATITPGIAPTHGGAARQASPSARIAARAEESTAAPADTSSSSSRTTGGRSMMRPAACGAT